MSVDLRPVNRVKELCARADDQADCFYPLYIEVANVCLVLLKKRLEMNSFSQLNYADRRPFQALHCYCDASLPIRAVKPNPNSLETVGILIYPKEDGDSGTKESFWEGEVYQANNIASKLLQNKFSPSPMLNEGFEYRHQGIVVRGHAKHVASEMSALGSLRDEFEEELALAEEYLTSVDPALKEQVREASEQISKIQSLMTKEQFNPSALSQMMVIRVNTLFEIAEKINQLRLYEKNPGTDEEISKEKEKARKEVTKISELLNKGYFTQAVCLEDVEALEEGLGKCHEAIALIKRIALSEDQGKLKEHLKDSLIAKSSEFQQVITSDSITSANGPIVRICHVEPLNSAQGALHGCWYLLVKIIDIYHQDRYETLLPKVEYRNKLLDLLKKENDFFIKHEKTRVGLGSQMDKYQEDINALEKIHNYWKQFDDLPNLLPYSRGLDIVRKDLVQEFEKQLGFRLGGLSYQLLHPSYPSHESPFSDHLNEVIPLLLKRVELIDEQLILTKLCETPNGRIHYRDPDYSEKRRMFDGQLFLVMVSYLTMAIIERKYKVPSEAMKEIASFLQKYLTAKRTYGLLEATNKFTTAEIELGQYLTSPISILGDIAELLEDIDAALATDISKFADQLSISASEFEELGQKIVRHLETNPQDTSFWESFEGFAKERKDLETQLQVRIEGACQGLKKISFASKSFDANFPDEKKGFFSSLERIRTLESRRSQLGKESNSIIQIDNQPNALGRVNRGITDAKAAVGSLKTKLSGLKKGTTEYDRYLRDRAVDKLTDVEATLVPNPSNEFYIRIQGIRKTLKMKFEGNPNLAKAFKADVESLGISYSESDPESCLNALHAKIKELSPETQKILRQFEIKHAIELIDKIYKKLTYKQCVEQGEIFMNRTKELKLSLIKREWLSGLKRVVSTYSWMKNDPQEDPHFRTNETHIRI